MESTNNNTNSTTVVPEETTGAEAQEIQVPLPQINTDSRFVLRVVWLEKNIAIAVDYVVNKGLSP